MYKRFVICTTFIIAIGLFGLNVFNQQDKYQDELRESIDDKEILLNLMVKELSEFKENTYLIMADINCDELSDTIDKDYISILSVTSNNVTRLHELEQMDKYTNDVARGYVYNYINNSLHFTIIQYNDNKELDLDDISYKIEYKGKQYALERDTCSYFE